MSWPTLEDAVARYEVAYVVSPLQPDALGAALSDRGMAGGREGRALYDWARQLLRRWVTVGVVQYHSSRSVYTCVKSPSVYRAHLQSVQNKRCATMRAHIGRAKAPVSVTPRKVDSGVAPWLRGLV